MATELVAHKVALIHTGTDLAALAAKEATSSIPITFVIGSDPVKLKLASSINQPAGNATGITVGCAQTTKSSQVCSSVGNNTNANVPC